MGMHVCVVLQTVQVNMPNLIMILLVFLLIPIAMDVHWQILLRLMANAELRACCTMKTIPFCALDRSVMDKPFVDG